MKLICLCLLSCCAVSAQPLTLNAYGDSITAGTGSTDCWDSQLSRDTCYIGRLASDEGWILAGHPVGGSQLFDQIKYVWATPTTSNTLSSFLIGGNESYYLPDAPNNQDLWQGALRAAYVWLTTPNKTPGSALQRTGQWQPDPIYPAGIFTTGSASISATVKGSAIYIATRSTPSNPATFQITVDGKAWGSPLTMSIPWVSGFGSNFAPYLIRIPNLGNTRHSIVITNLSGEFHIDFIATNQNQRGPRLLAATYYETIYEQHSTFATLNALIRETAAELQWDGLGVLLADVQSACSTGLPTGGANCSQYDGVHPTDAGHAIIAGAFERAFR